MPGETLDPKQLIASILAGQSGGAPAVSGAPAAAAPGAPAAPAQPKADPTPTQTEQAIKDGAPKDPSAKASDDAFTFIDVDDGDGGKRAMTPQQIAATMKRYSDLNFKHASLKPVLGFVEQIMETAKKNGREAKPDEVRELLETAVSAYLKNPKMGGDGKKAATEQKPAQPPMSGDSDPDDEAFSAWEKENAVKLPPGFKEQGAALKAITAQMNQLMQMVQQGIQQGGATGQAMQAAQAQAQQGQAASINGARLAIDNNIKAAMAQNQIAADPAAASDFFMFATQRGYSPEDFIDPQLAATVVSDYKANKDAPEIARLREVMQRRQAFTGAVEGAPGGASAPAAAGGDPMLAKMVSSAMASRNMR